jgi:Fe2+ transport system protein FeoA
MRFLTSRRRFVQYALAFGVPILAVGCSEGAATQDANAPIKVETSQMYVTLRNQTGMALTEVTVTIIPVGRSTQFSKFLGRLESNENRNVMLGDFVGRDGTPFSLRVTKAKAVQVTGVDIAGKKHEVLVDWR